MALVRLSRIFSVAAAHKLNSPGLSAEENASIYGKCHRLHGHNYKIKVTLKGKADPNTGMLINVSVLKSIAERSFVNILDHHDIDQDIPYFFNRPSTMENLVVFIWTSLTDGLKEAGFDPKILDEVEIYETECNSVTFRGEFAP